MVLLEMKRSVVEGLAFFTSLMTVESIAISLSKAYSEGEGVKISAELEPSRDSIA